MGSRSCRRVHSCSRGFNPARVGVVGFKRVRVSSPRRTKGSYRFSSVHYGGPGGRRVHSGSRVSTRSPTGVIRFIRVCVGTFERSLRSPGPFLFSLVHYGALRYCRYFRVCEG